MPALDEPRVTSGLLVLYAFEEGAGTAVYDTSGAAEPLNLTVRDETAIRWLPGALSIESPTIVLSDLPARRVSQAARATSELTIEAWVRPSSTDQSGPARIASLSHDPYNRNFTLGQGLWGNLPSSLYDVRLRTTETDPSGVPSLSTPPGSLQAALSHVVYTRNAAGTASIYINGEQQASRTVGGDFSGWDDNYHLALANELTGDRPWLGEFHLLAIYNRALAPDEIGKNYRAGPNASSVETITAPQADPPPAPAGTSSEPAEASPAPGRSGDFPLGIFEDAGMIGGNAELFRALINDVQARGFDSLMFANNRVSRDTAMLAVSDELGLQVFMMPAWDFDRTWWPPEVPETIEAARLAAAPVVAAWGPHPSLKGYIVKDEPERYATTKVALMTQALRELDPARPATPILIGTNRVGPIFSAAQPEVMLIDVYPAGKNNPIGDFTLTGFGYHDLDFVEYIRLVGQDRPANKPLWIILQTHSFESERFALREPVPAEVRAQNWLAIGEGATGIFWFIYGTQQSWRGLADNPPLYQEVTDLARRVGPLREILLSVRKVEDMFHVSGNHQPYVSTLSNSEKLYAVVVNRDCEQPQAISVHSQMFSGRLRDVETGQIYDLGAPVLFEPGDGKLFELVTE